MPSCRAPNSERVLNAIVASLIMERRLPNGSIVDAGAFEGKWSCFYATVAAAADSPPDVRVVHALDPDAANVKGMRGWARKLPNLRPMVGLLGEEVNASLTLRDLARRNHGAQGGGAVRVRNRTRAYREALVVPEHTLDELFTSPGGAWAGERLALAHIDVEGHELAVLRGALAVVRRDRPVIVTEAIVHSRREAAEAVLRHVRALGYDSYLIEEVAGIRADIRNLLHVPREMHASLRDMGALDVAVAARALQAVSAETIGQHAFPCCVRGGECCPAGGRDCCAHYRVDRWLRQSGGDHGGDLQWFTRHTWYDQSWLRFGRADEMLLLQQQVRARGAGFSYLGKPNRSRLAAVLPPMNAEYLARHGVEGAWLWNRSRERGRRPA